MATADECAIEYAKCAADAAYFCHTYLSIDDAQDDGGGVQPFRLWPAQIDLLWTLMVERRTIILKARQLGISWLCCAYALWLCWFQPGRAVLIYSRGQLEANKLLGRIARLEERMPDWLRAAGPALDQANTTVRAWAHGSRIESLPASPGSGRGDTASLVILDEAAFLQVADDLYAALKPTIDGGGQLIILSTANGVGNLFHRLWTRAVSGASGMRAVFLPWQARPDRDPAWYERQLAEYPDPAIVRQEYPATPAEAFIVSGRVRFAPEWIARAASGVRPGLPVQAWPAALQSLDGLTLWTLPPPGRRTILAADVAEGLEHGDASAATLIDAATWEQLGELHGQWEPDVFARRLDQLAQAYDAEVAVERNNHGHAVLVALKSLPSWQRIVRGVDQRPGWVTNAQTKPLMIDGLAVALRDGLAIVRAQAALDEMQIYRVLPNGGTGAPAGFHDDRVIAWAIAIAVAQQPPPVAEAAPNRLYSNESAGLIYVPGRGLVEQ